VEEIFLKARNHFSENVNQVSHFCRSFDGAKPPQPLPLRRQAEPRPETPAGSIGPFRPMDKPQALDRGLPEGWFVLPPVTAVGVSVGVVVWIGRIIGIGIIIGRRIIIGIVRIRVIICAGLPTAFRTDYSVLRKSDQANRIGG
jgi:hypothetical protein